MNSEIKDKDTELSQCLPDLDEPVLAPTPEGQAILYDAIFRAGVSVYTFMRMS